MKSKIKDGDLKSYLNSLKLQIIKGAKQDEFNRESVMLPLDRQVDWSTQLLCALNYFSTTLSDPIVHRDIKPEFVFWPFEYFNSKIIYPIDI